MPSNWSTPPGESPNHRATARKLIVSFLVGVLSLGVAWAGTGLVPVNDLIDKERSENKTFVGMEQEPAGVGDSGNSDSLPSLAAGQIYAGAAKVSLYPRPEDYQTQFPGARWERDEAKCQNLTNPTGVQEGLKDITSARVRWAENTDCIFMGGYGIGPMFPITSWDEEYGLWSRSVAMSDGKDAVVLTLIDAVYWEAYYNSMCPGAPRTPASQGGQNCGWLDLALQLSAETGLPPKSFVFASTHSHTAPDFIGGWGGVPEWYMQQAIDSIKASTTQALQSLEPAVLEAGEEIVRDRSSERRDFYRSAEDDGLSWFRLIDADSQPRPETCTTPTAPDPSPTSGGQGNGYGNTGKQTPAPAPTPVCEPAAPGKAIATVGAYAAHPVTEDESGGQGDADFPAVFAKRVEEAYGGVGMFLQTGLGNISPRGDKIAMGNGLASHIPAIGGGEQVIETDVRVGRDFWPQPVTNVPLGHLGAAGVFDRTFNQAPAVVKEGKGGEENKKCTSASHVSVETSVSAAKIGSLWITGAPGEVFSNFTNTIEERNPNGITLALGLVNDGLGYIIQSFETDHVGRQGVGFVGKAGQPDEMKPYTPPQTHSVGLSEYEDAYSIDHCFGDAALEKTIRLLGEL